MNTIVITYIYILGKYFIARQSNKVMKNSGTKQVAEIFYKIVSRENEKSAQD